MTRQSVVSGDVQNGEEAVLCTLRPRLLSEYVGQGMVVENLGIAIEAAKGRSEPLDHILLHGPPGLGKTTLAHVIAAEMGAEITTTSGPAMERAADLVGILLRPLAALDPILFDHRPVGAHLADDSLDRHRASLR